MTLAPYIIETIPPANPTSYGLLNAVTWQPWQGPERWQSGIDIDEIVNYGGETSAGIWEPDWCASKDDLGPADIKAPGERPELPDTFQPVTVWSAAECDLTRRSRDDTDARARQIHRLQEPLLVEQRFATRLLGDAGAALSAVDIVTAVGLLEAAIAQTGTPGVIHAGAQWAAPAAAANLLVRAGAALVTPLGNRWVFGGGYVQSLGDTLVATGPLYGWRGEVRVFAAPKLEHNRYRAIAERSTVLAYEALVAAVEISADSEGEA